MTSDLLKPIKTLYVWIFLPICAERASRQAQICKNYSRVCASTFSSVIPMTMPATTLVSGRVNSFI